MARATSDPDVDSDTSVWGTLGGVMGSPFGGGGENDSLRDALETTWASLAGVPEALRDLSPLAKDLLTDPRKTVIGIVITWAITSVLGFTTNVLALVFEGIELVAGIPASVGASLGVAGGGIQATIFGLLEAAAGGAVSLVAGLGWYAPLVFALVAVLLMEITEELTPPALHALSDLLGAIPVVGSILDALLTFLIGVGERVFGGGRS